MGTTTAYLLSIFDEITSHNSSLATILSDFLENDDPAVQQHAAVQDFSSRLPEVLRILARNQSTRQLAMKWAKDKMVSQFSDEILALVYQAPGDGRRFNVKSATAERLENLDIYEMAEEMETLAPTLWALLDVLLSADPVLLEHRAKDRARYAAKRGREPRKARANIPTAMSKLPGDDVDMIDASRQLEVDEDGLEWEDVDAAMFESVEQQRTLDPHALDEAADTEEALEEAEARRQALVLIKKVVCISIMLHSTNQRCNSFQTLIGIFLHSCNAPETLIDALAHMGISISVQSIHNAIDSLSADALKRLRELAQTLLTAYAYDNLDINLPHATPTVEKAQQTLIHMTTGTLIPLMHGVKREHLDCAAELWSKSPLNDNRTANHPRVTFIDLLKIHPEVPHPTNLTRRQRFNAWMFLHDLVHHGPEYFRQFVPQLGQPEEVECIPVVQTHQVHARMMDTPCSSAADQANILTDLIVNQGHVGGETKLPDGRLDPKFKALLNYVILIFGDLGVGERLQSLLESRSEEETPWRRQQFVIYVMGLFHVKMACADALWRIFIKPKSARQESDPDALMQYVKIMRPKETGKIETNPGFRRMHEVIQHVGIVSRLDCWRLEASETTKKDFDSLDAFAETKPSWDDLVAMSYQLARKYVADGKFSLDRQRSSALRDEVNENAKLRMQYFLLYEEITYAMNWGDIGRVETTFMPWSYIFHGCGKHKYAKQLRRYLRDVHYWYPPDLARAIRMNILISLKPRRGFCRAVDWVVEHNNMYEKTIYGGKYSNHTKERMIKESPLIGVYKNARIQVGRMFRLRIRTSKHSGPKMRRTFQKLGIYMRERKSQKFVPARSSPYSIPNIMATGQHIVMTQPLDEQGATEEKDDVDMEDADREEEEEEEENLEVDDFDI